MSPAAWLLLAACLLLIPWTMLPRPRERSEVRGIRRILWWLNACYCAFWHRLEVAGPAPLPEHGPALLIANHTCGIDHLILQAGCRRVLGFLTAQEYYDAWYCRPFCRLLGCIPVRRDGHDVAAARAALRALSQGRVVPIFPEGRITPRSGREFGQAKPGAAFIALHARVPVIPAYIRGTPETNDVLEALRTPSRARVVFGPPIDLSRLWARGRVERDDLAEVTEILMGAIRALTDGQVQGPFARAEILKQPPLREPAHALAG